MGDILRFVSAQERTHAAALREIKSGHKVSHWSWWEIPQIAGLGRTPTSQAYAIADLTEAKEYLAHEILRTHLTELCEALLSLETDDPERVMGYPDDLKLRSCMTLFREADPSCGIFQTVLDKFFCGQPDPRTLFILKTQDGPKEPAAEGGSEGSAAGPSKGQTDPGNKS